jgi:hypothetical protein
LCVFPAFSSLFKTVDRFFDIFYCNAAWKERNLTFTSQLKSVSKIIKIERTCYVLQKQSADTGDNIEK